LTECAPAADTLPPEPVDRATAKLQDDFLSWKFGLFLHFNMATYVGKEWANGYEDPALFQPDKLDCSQWADAARAAGMNYAVLTVKHTEGYCLWDSALTTHDMTAFHNYNSGKGDVVRQFVDAFRSRGLKVGFYYCFPGNYSGDTTHRTPIPHGEPNLFGLPPEAAGDHVGFIKKQMTELLSNYGPIDLIWADQYGVMLKPAQWHEIKSHIKSLQPNCLVLGNNAKNLIDSDVFSYETPLPGHPFPPPGNTVPSEVCDILDRRGWFWKGPAKPEDLKTAREVVDTLQTCNRRRTNYLLDVPPDPHGLISGLHLQRMHEIGALVDVASNDPKK
jgi:alpha-L-fucosidase